MSGTWAPQRAVKNIQEGLRATHAELAANGITTAVLAQFYSWEGGMRGPEFATQFFETLQAFAPSVPSTLLPQLRFETYMYAHYDNIVALCPKYDIPYLVFNDHLPHKELAAGKRPPRLAGQALKAQRSPDAHHAYLRELHEASDRVQKHLPDLIEALGDTILLGSHNASAKEHATWAERGISICEFPETQEAAEQAHQRGNCVVMGAPNVLRGGSHKKNVGAKLLIENHLCDALASDYHYPAQRLPHFSLPPDRARSHGRLFRPILHAYWDLKIADTLLGNVLILSLNKKHRASKAPLRKVIQLTSQVSLRSDCCCLSQFPWPKSYSNGPSSGPLLFLLCHKDGELHFSPQQAFLHVQRPVQSNFPCAHHNSDCHRPVASP